MSWCILMLRILWQNAAAIKNFVKFTGKYLCRSLYISVKFTKYESIWQTQKQTLEVFCEKRCTEKFHRKTPLLGHGTIRSLFLIKLQQIRPAVLLKLDSNTDVFLWNLWNFQEHLCTLTNICQQMFLQTKGSKKLTLCRVRKTNPI